MLLHERAACGGADCVAERLGRPHDWLRNMGAPYMRCLFQMLAVHSHRSEYLLACSGTFRFPGWRWYADALSLSGDHRSAHFHSQPGRGETTKTPLETRWSVDRKSVLLNIAISIVYVELPTSVQTQGPGAAATRTITTGCLQRKFAWWGMGAVEAAA